MLLSGATDTFGESGGNGEIDTYDRGQLSHLSRCSRRLALRKQFDFIGCKVVYRQHETTTEHQVFGCGPLDVGCTGPITKTVVHTYTHYICVRLEERVGRRGGFEGAGPIFRFNKRWFVGAGTIGPDPDPAPVCLQ